MSVLDFLECAKYKCNCYFAYKIRYIMYLILAAHPCASGISEQAGDSSKIIRKPDWRIKNDDG